LPKFHFHGVEKVANLGSMPWKNGEFDFHGVELFAPQRETTTPRRLAAFAKDCDVLCTYTVRL
jgi:hypothetical protein